MDEKEQEKGYEVLAVITPEEMEATHNYISRKDAFNELINELFEKVAAITSDQKEFWLYLRSKYGISMAEGTYLDYHTRQIRQKKATPNNT